MATGCYTEQYLPGSFKDVPFYVESTDSEHGRRGAEGEFPFAENTAYADLGRRIRSYTVQARFHSNNHVSEAADLIAACEATGPGILVHPTRGVLTSVACKSLKVTDNIEEAGGVTTVEMTFVEANVRATGLSLAGSIFGLDVATIIGVARDAFTQLYDIAGVQSFRRTAVVASAQAQMFSIADSYAEATTSAQTEENRNRALQDMRTVAADYRLASVTSTADTTLALGMEATARALTGTAKFDAFRNLANGAAAQSSFNSPAAEAENTVYSTVRILAAAYMAQGALESSDLRTGQILSRMDAVDAVLEQEVAYARSTCQNYLHEALKTFRVDASAQLADRAYNAPGLLEYSFGGQVHSLTAAYAIHGDGKRLREVEALNVVSTQGRMGPRVSAVAL